MLSNRFQNGSGLRVTFGWVLRVGALVTLFSIPLVSYLSA